jgi:hypothetical protein
MPQLTRIVQDGILEFCKRSNQKLNNLKVFFAIDKEKWVKVLVVFITIVYAATLVVNDVVVKYDKKAYDALVGGSESWQEYQNKEKYQQINLKNVKFYKKNFQGYKFKNVNFSDMQCFGCIFQNSQFYDVKFDGSYLQSANFQNVIIDKASFVDIFGPGISFENSKIINTIFKRNYFMQGDFTSNHLENISFIDSNLFDLYFIKNVFRGVNFINGTDGIIKSSGGQN